MTATDKEQALIVTFTLFLVVMFGALVALILWMRHAGNDNLAELQYARAKLAEAREYGTATEVNFWSKEAAERLRRWLLTSLKTGRGLVN